MEHAEAPSNRADHWQFALACAVKYMRQVIFEFDFHNSLSGHAVYVGITPELLSESIDGFLSERESVPGGTVTELEDLRKKLLEAVAPAYEAGRNTAHSAWAIATHDEEREKLLSTPPEDIMLDAWRHVPLELSSSQANWFVEGFCSTWAQEGFEWQVSKLKRDT